MSPVRWTLCAVAVLIAGVAVDAASSCEGCGPVVTAGYFPYVPNICCGPSIRPIAYACPVIAPPSGAPATFSTPEPPSGKQPRKGPIIDQYRTFNGVPQMVEPRTEKCKVSFWNLTGDDVTLFVGNEPRSVLKDRAVVLDLSRQFSWRTNNLNPKSEDVPDDTNHFEVLIR